MAETEENKNEAYDGSQIFYQDDKVMLLKCNTLESAKYFGPPFFSKYYNRYRDADNYIIVDKEGDYLTPTLSYLIHKPHRGQIEFFNYDNDDLTMTDILEKFPEITDKIYELIGVSSTYNILKRISGGEDIDEYKFSNIDDLIGGFKFNKNNPGKSMVTLNFDDHEDYFKLFDLGEGDLWFLKALFSSYHYDSIGFYHSDTGYQDWDEGYLMRDLNEENIEIIKQILIYIKPNLAELNNDDQYKEASVLLRDTFSRQTENIIDDYSHEKDSGMQKAAEEEIREELCEPFQNYGLFAKSGCFYTYVTTVNVLLGMYNISKERHVDLKGMLSKIGHTMSVGPYEEYMYEYGSGEFDIDSVNRNAKYELEKILEEIEDSNKYPNLIKFREMVDEVLSQYDLNKYYNLKRGTNTEGFRVTKLDPTTNKIYLTYYKSGLTRGSESEVRSYTLEEFRNFLHNPELFENKILNFRKKS
jgi:hypothetical protein